MAQTTTPKKSFNFTSPETIMMMSLAVCLDLTGYVLILAVLDDFWLTDIAGILIMGSWIFIRSGGKRIPTKSKGIPGLKRFGLATLIEVIPYIGSLCPSWTIMVYKEIKNNS